MEGSSLKQLAEDAGDPDPMIALQAITRMQREISGLEAVAVRRARVAGLSWAQIAAALGVSRQAVHQKHGGSRFSRG